MTQTINQCGYVAIIGRPNVGKSTLLNNLVGEKISIVSRKPQTTRTQILGVSTQEPFQAVYLDTPGIHQDEKRAINRYMNRLATSVIVDADIVIWMIEASGLRPDDEIILKKCLDIKKPIILVINKVDLLKDKSKLLTFIDELKSKLDFKAIFPLSARKKPDIVRLQKLIYSLLPEGEPLFPRETLTDKNVNFRAAELIREKLIHSTGQELPYSTTVIVDSMGKKGKMIHIHATIWVEREGQKPIVIGKDGERLKKIGTLARKDIEKLLGKKVFLELWVKVKSNWTDNEQLLGSFGNL